MPAILADRQLQDAKRSLRELMERLSPGHDVAFGIQVVVGDHDQGIINLADAVSADLVVIGKHRKDILLDLFRGSTGERVIRFGTRPVLVVKSRPAHGYARMVAAVDFSPPAAKAVTFALALAPQAEVKLLNAYDVPFRGLVRSINSPKSTSSSSRTWSSARWRSS